MQITTVDEAKTFYPLFGLGANVALIFSGRAVKYFSEVRAIMCQWCCRLHRQSGRPRIVFCAEESTEPVWGTPMTGITAWWMTWRVGLLRAGAVAAAARCGRVGLLTKGHDVNGCIWRRAHHGYLLLAATPRGSQGRCKTTQTKEEEAQHEPGRVNRLPGQITLHPRPRYLGMQDNNMFLYQKSWLKC